MLPHSVFGGRLVYSLKGVPSTATTMAAGSPENVIVESQAGFTQNYGTGAAAIFDMPAASTAGAYGDYTYARLLRAGMLCNQEVLWSYTNDTDESWAAFAVNSNGTSSDSGADDSCLKMSNGMAFDEFRCYTRNAGAFTQQWNTAAGITTGSKQWVRFMHKGSFAGGRTWVDGQTEPNDWDGSAIIDLLAAGVPTRGYTTLGTEGGNSGTLTFTLNVHDLFIWDLDRGIGAFASAARGGM